MNTVGIAALVLALAPAAAPAPDAPPDLAPATITRNPLGRAWRARWIWIPGEPAPKNSYVYFRKTFTVDDTSQTTRVFVTADSRYELYLNGKRIAHGPVRSDRRWLYYDSWDVTPTLHKGENVLAVLVHHYGEWTFQYMLGRGGLLAEVANDRGDVLAKSDASWKAQRSAAWASGQPRMDIQLEFNEVYDARKGPGNWTAADYDASSWQPAVEIGPAGMEPWPHLVPRDIPAMREEPLAPKEVLETAEVTLPEPAPVAQGALVSQEMAAEKRGHLRRASVDMPENAITSDSGPCRIRTAPGADASLLIDFGREVTGYPYFRLRGARGGEIVDAGYGEVLQDAEGHFLPQTPQPEGTPPGRLNPDRDGVHYADRYIARAGDQQCRTFEKRAFRYLQIDVRNAPEGVGLEDVGILFSTFPVEERGAFDSSDERLNKIWETGRYTCQLNMEDGYTDCPWRERGQWWGDARVEALINYYCFGDRTLIRKALRQCGQSQNAEGMTWGVYPTDWDGGRLPSFTLIWVSTLWDYYQHTGDQELVAELYPKVRYALDHFFAPRVGPRGLLTDVPYWVFIDWAPVDTAGECGALNAYYYDALRRAAEMARLLGRGEASAYEQRAEAVKQALNARLWDAAQHVYRDSLLPDGSLSSKISQQTNSLCVLFDVAPAADQGRILDFIYAPENQGRVVQAGSPYFSFYQLAALYHAGRHAQALAYVRRQWGRMLDWGATTWWETWQPGASFCHGWSGGPTYDLMSEFLGVKPLKPGFAEVSVAPHWGDLQFASGVVPTSKGPVRVAWQRDARSRTAAVRVEGPPGVPLEVTLPGTGEVKVDRKSRLPEGVVAAQSPPGTTAYRVQKGGTVLLELRERG